MFPRWHDAFPEKDTALWHRLRNPGTQTVLRWSKQVQRNKKGNEELGQKSGTKCGCHLPIQILGKAKESWKRRKKSSRSLKHFNLSRTTTWYSFKQMRNTSQSKEDRCTMVYQYKHGTKRKSCKASIKPTTKASHDQLASPCPGQVFQLKGWSRCVPVSFKSSSFQCSKSEILSHHTIYDSRAMWK